jgi:hypothetical protein
MAIHYYDGSNVSSEGDTTIGITIPLGTAVDSIAIIGLILEDSNSDDNVYDPTDCTRVAGAQSNKTGGCTVVWWKRIDGTEGYTFDPSWDTATNATAMCMIFTGCQVMGDVIDAWAIYQDYCNVSTTALQTGDIIPSNANGMYVAICGIDASDTTSTTMTISDYNTLVDMTDPLGAAGRPSKGKPLMAGAYGAADNSTANILAVSDSANNPYGTIVGLNLKVSTAFTFTPIYVQSISVN